MSIEQDKLKDMIVKAQRVMQSSKDVAVEEHYDSSTSEQEQRGEPNLKDQQSPNE